MQKTVPPLPDASLGQRATRLDMGITLRFVLVAALSLTLLEAGRWAMDVTNANARRISTNMLRLRDEGVTRSKNEQEPSQIAPRRHLGTTPFPKNAGPVIEPEGGSIRK